jgi:hypothetical protein
MTIRIAAQAAPMDSIQVDSQPAACLAPDPLALVRRYTPWSSDIFPPRSRAKRFVLTSVSSIFEESSYANCTDEA